MQHINCTIRFDQPWLPLIHHQNDQCIMDILLDSILVNYSKLDVINWSCFYQKATFMSRITSADGKFLASDLGEDYPPYRAMYNNECVWPHQVVPNSELWHFFNS
eukprot:2334004-Ditylum_brightwellii.AAC.1